MREEVQVLNKFNMYNVLCIKEIVRANINISNRMINCAITGAVAENPSVILKHSFF